MLTLILALVGGALLLAGGGTALALAKRSRAHGRWTAVAGEAAKRLAGRASPGSMFDAPELRAEIEGITVTVRLESREGGVAVATATLPETAASSRLFFGWDLPPAPEIQHIPDVDVRTRIAGSVVTKAENAALASRVIDRIIADLIDVKREANASGLSVTCRGGYATLTVSGLSESPFMIERIAIVSARIAKVMGEAASGTMLAPPSIAALCTICEASGDGETWVACTSCSAPYHKGCFDQATACVADGCDGREAV